LIGRLGRWVLLASCLLAAPLWAEVPDPIRPPSSMPSSGAICAVKRWLDEGLSPEYQAAHIGTGLMVAAWYGHIEMMALFVERGADLRRTNRNGEQALQLAAWGGHLEAVKWLLEHGAPLDREGNQWGALHYAVFNGHEKVVSDLLARGANVNARAPNGATPLMMAAREGHDGIWRGCLLEAGANTETPERLGRYGADHGDALQPPAAGQDDLLTGGVRDCREGAAGELWRSDALGGGTDEIEAIMKEIRAAEAEGRPSEELHKKLRARSMTCVEPVRRRWRSGRCRAPISHVRW
jgi:hypothetical protein